MTTEGTKGSTGWRVYCVLAFALAAWAAWRAVARARFPWDVYLWSESPFLTNMLRLSRGEGVYGPPGDANSFVYSPGLEWLTYAVLAPFGRQLDVRWCRGVSIGLSALAALAYARCSVLVGRRLYPEGLGRLFFPAAAATFFLILQRNFTADVPHPDNLYLLHAALTLLLTLEAVRTGSFGLALAAVVVAGLGVVAKQVAALAAAGAWLALAVALPRGWRAKAALGVAGAAAAAGSLALLWSLPWCKFYAFDLLASHGVVASKVVELLVHFAYTPHRLLGLLFFGWAADSVWKTNEGGRKAWAAPYVGVFAFEGAPAVLGFLKVMGGQNNLAVVEVWMAVLALPWLAALLRRSAAEADGRRFVALAAAWAIALAPARLAPTRDHHRFARTFQRLVGDDLAAGQRVLVAHGLTFQLRAGRFDVPLDRANSCLELDAAWKDGALAWKGGLEATRGRLDAGAYDKIYWNTDFYPPSVAEAIERNYREVGRIPGVPGQTADRGFQANLMLAVRVMERRPR